MLYPHECMRTLWNNNNNGKKMTNIERILGLFKGQYLIIVFQNNNYSLLCTFVENIRTRSAPPEFKARLNNENSTDLARVQLAKSVLQRSYCCCCV